MIYSTFPFYNMFYIRFIIGLEECSTTPKLATKFSRFNSLKVSFSDYVFNHSCLFHASLFGILQNLIILIDPTFYQNTNGIFFSIVGF
jgi:hypothetical protein